MKGDSKSRPSGYDHVADIDSAVDGAEVLNMRTLHNNKLGAVLYRYDQRMCRGWDVLLPLSLVFVVLVSRFLMFTRVGA